MDRNNEVIQSAKRQQQGDETNDLGDASLRVHSLFTRLALPKYDANVPLPLWSHVCRGSLDSSL